MTARRARAAAGAALAAVLACTGGCQALRLHAKDLLYHPSPAVSVPAWTATVLFVAPPAVAFLPVSGPVVAIAQDEDAIWFALAPGILVGAPILFLIATPIYWIVGPAPEEADASEDKR